MEWKRDDFTVSDDPKRIQFDAICRLLWGTYWAVDRGKEAIARSLENSLCFGVYRGTEQVAIARVVTDRATVGYLCDVVIANECRGSGVGRWFIACILEHPDLKDCRIDLFTRDAQEFYRPFGFGPHRYTSMVRYPPGDLPAAEPHAD